MTQETTLREIKVLLSCPGDAYKECGKAIREAIEQLNQNQSKQYKIKLTVLHWSTDSYAKSGEEPQSILNSQIVDIADMAIAIFWTRFGTPTEKYGSGTEEEIARLIEAKKQVFLYFYQKPVPYERCTSPDFQEEMSRINDFRKRYRGIFNTAADEAELKEKIVSNFERFFRETANWIIPEKSGTGLRWVRSDTREEVAPDKLTTFENMKVQLDGPTVRGSVAIDDERDVYFEADALTGSLERIISPGFPQEYTPIISPNLIISVSENWKIVNGCSYLFKIYHLKFGGRLELVYDLADTLVNGSFHSPAGMKLKIDPNRREFYFINQE